MDCTMDCAICRCDMGVSPYEVNTENADVPVNETILRLKCGHAYHSMCVVMALRSSPKCPLCRDEPTNNDDEEEIELAHPIEIFVDMQELERVEESIAILEGIRTRVPRVQQTRCQYNKERHKLIQYGQELEQKRKQEIQKTVAEFRKKYRDEWESKKRFLQRKLNKVKEVEHQVITAYHGEEQATQVIQEAEYSYKLQYDVGVSPMRKGFWTH